MAKEDMQRGPISLVKIGRMQMKPTKREHFSPTILENIKPSDNINRWQGLSSTAGWGVNLYNHFGEQAGNI